MNSRLQTLVATNGYKLEFTFADCEVGIYDCAPLLDFGVFQEFRGISYFKRVCVEGGTIVWPHEQDLCPDTVYEDSKMFTAE